MTSKIDVKIILEALGYTGDIDENLGLDFRESVSEFLKANFNVNFFVGRIVYEFDGEGIKGFYYNSSMKDYSSTHYGFHKREHAFKRGLGEIFKWLK